MRVGPLGCLGMLATGVAGWAAGRVPALYAEIAAAMPAPMPAPLAAQPPVLQSVDTPVPTAPAMPAAPIIVTMPTAPAPQIIVVRDGRAEGRDAGPEELRWTLPDATRSAEATGSASAPAATATAAAPEAQTGAAAPPSGEGTGFELATLAYTELAHGNRREAAARFSAALALDPGAPEAKAWRKELNRLRRRWSIEGYTVLRDDGTGTLGVNPVLGGGQTSAQVAYTRRPLARRPLYAVARLTVANSGGFSTRSGAASSAQAALGLRWQAVPQISVSGERTFRINHTGRAAWTVRAAGGYAHQLGPVLADAYAEAGVVGFNSLDPFASLQARAAVPFSIASLRVEPGVGLWSGWQRTGVTVDRVDLGPTVTIASDKWNLRASADYRLKIRGNAKPGSGPAVTISSAF